MHSTTTSAPTNAPTQYVNVSFTLQIDSVLSSASSSLTPPTEAQILAYRQSVAFLLSIPIRRVLVTVVQQDNATLRRKRVLLATRRFNMVVTILLDSVEEAIALKMRVESTTFQFNLTYSDPTTSGTETVLTIIPETIVYKVPESLTTVLNFATTSSQVAVKGTTSAIPRTSTSISSSPRSTQSASNPSGASSSVSTYVAIAVPVAVVAVIVIMAAMYCNKKKTKAVLTQDVPRGQETSKSAPSLKYNASLPVIPIRIDKIQKIHANLAFSKRSNI
jgi:hypothetical protein